MRGIAIQIAVQAGIDDPGDDVEGGAEARGQAVADGMVKVVAEDERCAGDGGRGGEAEGDGVLIVPVRRVREVRGRGGGGAGQAAVVLDADPDRGGAVRGRDFGWLRGVDGDGVVRRRVIRWSRRHAQEVFVCHCRWWRD